VSVSVCVCERERERERDTERERQRDRETERDRDTMKNVFVEKLDIYIRSVALAFSSSLCLHQKKIAYTISKEKKDDCFKRHDCKG
jgi:hypothetical protein